MLPNCEHEDCGECLELAEACSGIRFNNMVMMAQVVNRYKTTRKSKCWSANESWSNSDSGEWRWSWSRTLIWWGSWSLVRSWSGAKSGSKTEIY